MKKVLLFAIVLGLAACVPQRLMEETKTKLENCDKELAAIKKSAQENETKLAELAEQSEKNNKIIDGLKKRHQYHWVELP